MTEGCAGMTGCGHDRGVCGHGRVRAWQGVCTLCQGECAFLLDVLSVRHTGEAVIMEKAVKLPTRSRTTLPAEKPKIHTLIPVSAEISAKKVSDFRPIKKPNRDFNKSPTQ